MQLFQLMVSVAFAVMWSLSHFCSFWWTWFFYFIFFFLLYCLEYFPHFHVSCVSNSSQSCQNYDVLLVALPWRGYSECLLLTTLFTFLSVCVFVIWITYSGWMIPKIPKITWGFLLSKGRICMNWNLTLQLTLFSLLLTLILLIIIKWQFIIFTIIMVCHCKMPVWLS